MTDPDARRLLWFLFAGSRGGTGRIILDYSKSVNIVTGGEGTLYLSEDEQALSAKGADVASDGSAATDGQRLYNLVSHNYGRHRLVIDAVGNDFQVYTFTFGQACSRP